MSDHIKTDTVRSLLGVQICNALGLNHSHVTRLDMVIEAGELPILTVTRAVFGNDCAALEHVLEQYQITPIVSAPQAADQVTTESN